MIWNLEELQEDANIVATNKKVKDLFQDYYYETVWFYFYDQEKQVKYVSEPNDIYDWKVYALLKAGHIYVLTKSDKGSKEYSVYCYEDVDSSDGSGASYSNTLIILDTRQSFGSPEEIFNDEHIVSSYAIPNITKIEDLGKNNIARDLATLAHMYKSKQESYFNPKYELLGRYKGHCYNHINIEEDTIKIVLSGEDSISLSIEDYLVALAETEGIKQLDLAFKDYGISYKLEINK